ncbi:hypothetical protein EYF80_038356 [Liparis tanakae]|uniref:Uncharacterized protein n=1 Tax=Liparis tanakae TaxID=230148 RepID=A0A4Z2GFF9_9TELE|nr:hypothetical protein EYF80_038356 [Liparis tanakae]
MANAVAYTLHLDPAGVLLSSAVCPVTRGPDRQPPNRLPLRFEALSAKETSSGMKSGCAIPRGSHPPAEQEESP